MLHWLDQKLAKLIALVTAQVEKKTVQQKSECKRTAEQLRQKLRDAGLDDLVCKVNDDVEETDT